MRRHWLEALFFTACILFIIGCCAGCRYAFISKADLYDTYENYRTYRAYVKPIADDDRVNELGDLIEATLKEWKGDRDGDKKP